MSNTIEAIADLHWAFDAADAFDSVPPVHPGDILRVEFMEPFDLSAGAVARAIGLPRSRIKRIVKREIGISTDTALRLARLFRTSHQFWLNLQSQFESATLLPRIGDELARITPMPEAA
ncbi:MULTISPECIES: HigA family addiction module antitoxin [unclassified Methylobacterium]|uniref:HigA family addiction module antitoxin n=1 Tax=unclassified Methylobacterium TaxID=2615210 RepID=UPI00226ACD79|nr:MULTISPECIES: HigA family addiction module antitoxin [unclassified Methylobacterium]